MRSFLAVLWLAMVVPLAAAEAKPLRYLRPQGDQYVLESEVSVKQTENGALYTSRTERPGETLTLTVRRDAKGRALNADIIVKRKDAETSAKVEIKNKEAKLEAGGKTQTIEIGDNPVITSAPDWSDILALVERYDRAKGGKQESAGLWFHPTQPHRLLTFTVEKE